MRRDVRDALLFARAAREPGCLEAAYRFARDLPVFAGHFPGRPLLPGVFQIEMVRTAVEALTGRQYDLVRVGHAKFAGEVRPDETVQLDVRKMVSDTFTSGCLTPFSGRVRAALATDRGPAATISLVLRARDDSDGESG